MIELDKDLTPFTTFGIRCKAKLYAEYPDLKSLIKICRSDEYRENLVYHIGGGSNLLFNEYFDGMVLHSGIKGIRRYDKNQDTVFVIAGSGEKWTDLVDYCVSEGLAGLENLAGIPGEVGAAPVQNVGAYGVEASDCIHTVECLDRETLQVVKFCNYRSDDALEAIGGNRPVNECGFGYRTSNFKTIWKDRYFVLRVSFKLRISDKAANCDYGGLKGLAGRLGHAPLISEVREEVLRIRDSKLPNPAIIGSAGSFFKNPVVRRKYFEWEMLNHNADIPHYDIEGDPDHVKVPAGWLIEHAGLKGERVGGAIVYPENCLVIANAGSATYEDVRELARIIVRKVNAAFHVTLQPEVNYIDTDIRVMVLGSGTSKGVPELQCDCHVCRSENPLDHRLRASVFIEVMGVRILVDPSPDFRYQALKGDIRHIDAVLLTHEHYDHVGGIDDLRPYCLNEGLKMYAREDVDQHIRKRLDYCFRDNKYPGVPTFEMEVIDNRPFFVKGVKITPVEVFHGKLPIFGYRIGKFAYITDAKYITEEERDKLRDLDVLIVNALRERQHFAHFTVEEAMQLIEEVKPRQAYLTHLCHEVGLHHAFDATLPANVSPAYDGQEIVIR